MCGRIEYIFINRQASIFGNGKAGFINEDDVHRTFKPRFNDIALINRCAQRNRFCCAVNARDRGITGDFVNGAYRADIAHAAHLCEVLAAIGKGINKAWRQYLSIRGNQIRGCFNSIIILDSDRALRAIKDEIHAIAAHIGITDITGIWQINRCASGL